jgi:hypothetical protein
MCARESISVLFRIPRLLEPAAGFAQRAVQLRAISAATGPLLPRQPPLGQFEAERVGDGAYRRPAGVRLGKLDLCERRVGHASLVRNGLLREFALGAEASQDGGERSVDRGHGRPAYGPSSLWAMLDNLGWRRLTPDEFEEPFGDLPTDGEG